ncbi:MAG: Diedel family protein [Nitrospirae bacterium]|nr:MAG: Diedel family protein [Nitrospirota bacterium]
MKSRSFVIKGLSVFMGLLFLVAMSFATAEAKCCPNPGAGGKCHDGYKTKIGECCGVGKCNIFCCDCSKGCRKASDGGDESRKTCDDKCDSAHSTCSSGCTIACTGAPSDTCDILCDNKCSSERGTCKKGCESKYPSEAAEEQDCFNAFNAHDKNFDGHLSKGEFSDMVKKNNLTINEKSEFDEMDKNKDGRISHEEAGIQMPAAIKEKINSRKKK